MMNIAKQRGTTDCGLYAVTILICLAFGDDPTEKNFDQTALRLHLRQCSKRFFRLFPC